MRQTNINVNIGISAPLLLKINEEKHPIIFFRRLNSKTLTRPIVIALTKAISLVTHTHYCSTCY